MSGFASDENAAEQGRMPGLAFHQDLGPQELNIADPRSSVLSTPPKEPVDFLNRDWPGKDYQDYPLGLPRLAAYYVQFKNADSFRSHRYPLVRAILDTGLRCASLESKLGEHDRTHTAHLKGLTDNHKRRPGQQPVQDEYEDLMRDLKQELLEYHKLLRCLQDTQQLHPVPVTQYTDILRMVTGEEMLNEEAYALLFDSPHNMVSVSTPSNAAPIANFIRSKYGRWFLRCLSREDSDPHSRLVPEATAEWVLKCFFIVIGSILLIVPVGLLYMANLTKGQSFGVITGFTLLFGIVTMISKDWEMHKTLLAVCAFYAVLLTIGAQSSGMNPQSV
ncbi:hypothetical protein V8F06_002865 [Rhypophila decipiens]